MAVKILNTQQKKRVVEMVKTNPKAVVARHFNVSADTITRVIAEHKRAETIEVKAPQLPAIIVVEDIAYADDYADDAAGLVDRSKDVILSISRDLASYHLEEILDVFKSEPEYWNWGSSKKEKFQELIDQIEYHIAERSDSEIVTEDPAGYDPSLNDVIWSGNSRFLSIAIRDKVYSADSSFPGFKAALMACVEGDFQSALNIINTERAVEYYTSKSGNIRIEDGHLYWKDLILDTGLTRRIVERMQNGEDFEFFIPFLENLMMNPRRQAVIRLYDFLEANDIEITPHGTFYAWKKVRDDYKDIATGTFDNSVGANPKMDRNQVDEDDNVTCSQGLHVCSKSYLPSFAGWGKSRVMKVEVHPMNVVSIPVDYNNAKMRTCEYTVIQDCTDQF